MTESKVVNEWIREPVAKARLEVRRQLLTTFLERRFRTVVPAEIFTLIREQESPDLLYDWFCAAVDATTFEQFLKMFKR